MLPLIAGTAVRAIAGKAAEGVASNVVPQLAKHAVISLIPKPDLLSIGSSKPSSEPSIGI